MSNQNPCRAIIVGLGSQGQKTWFDSLQASSAVCVSAVCDNSVDVTKAFAAKHPDTPVYTALEALLAAEKYSKPDFAIVCVPNRYHLGVVARLAAAGIACLKEKPVAATTDEFRSLCDFSVDHGQSPGGIKIGVAFQRRWQPRYRNLRRLLPDIGRPLSVRAHMVGRYDPPQYGWRVRHNVGTFDDLGVHMLDVLVWLFGRPASVFAHSLHDDDDSAQKQQPLDSRDRESHVLMTWQGPGLIGHLYNSEVALQKDEELVVRGTRGSLHLGGNDIVMYAADGRKTLQINCSTRKQDVIESMCLEFYDYVRGSDHHDATFSTALAHTQDTLLTTEAIRASFASHAVEQVAHRVAYDECLRSELDPVAAMQGNGVGHHGEPDCVSTAGSDSAGSAVESASTSASTAASTTSGGVSSQKTYLLNSGYAMPAVGLGTRKPKRPQETYDAVREALRVGYRHIDTAFRYNNEEQVGAAVRDSGLFRQTVWVTTKIDNSWHHRVAESVETSLARLGLEYIDLVLMHWPSPVEPDNVKKALPNWNFIMTWQDMQKEVQKGRVRSIGVSNFGIRNLEKLLSHPTCSIVPAVNQLELHPYCPSSGLVAFCEQKGIHCTAYSPLAFGLPELHRHDVVSKVCERSGKTPQQVLIQWGLQRGTSVIPKSVKPERIASNFAAAFEAADLSSEDRKSIDDIEDRCRVYPDDWLPTQVFWEEDN